VLPVERQSTVHVLQGVYEETQAEIYASGGAIISMLAIFEMSCCGRKLIHGNFMGQEGIPITKAKCPFGCVLRNKKDRVAIRFVEYKTESMIDTELLKRWKYGKSGDLWHKYNREWLKRKEAAAQGQEPEQKKKRGK
jgi:hypothetical protein